MDYLKKQLNAKDLLKEHVNANDLKMDHFQTSSKKRERYRKSYLLYGPNNSDSFSVINVQKIFDGKHDENQYLKDAALLYHLFLKHLHIQEINYH